jgi:hypothetical protein
MLIFVIFIIFLSCKKQQTEAEVDLLKLSNRMFLDKAYAEYKKENSASSRRFSPGYREHIFPDDGREAFYDNNGNLIIDYVPFRTLQTLLNPINLENENKNYRYYIDEYDTISVKLFEIDGNFTNSGNREILAFYQRKLSREFNGNKYDNIQSVYCFVLDSSGEKLQSIYRIEYYTPSTNENESVLLTINEKDADSIEELGRDVIWLGWRIGCIGDFNGNGKEELYLFSDYDAARYPKFYEFNGTEFISILECDTNMWDVYSITGVDAVNKMIKFRNTYYWDGSWKDLTYIWDEEKQMYVEM